MRLRMCFTHPRTQRALMRRPRPDPENGGVEVPLAMSVSELKQQHIRDRVWRHGRSDHGAVIGGRRRLAGYT